MSKTADFKTPEEALGFWQQKITELTTGEGKDIQVSSFTAHLALTGLYQAMHTYAQERAVEFAEWCDASQYNYFGKGTWLGFDNVQYTTYGLYTIYLNQQNKK